MFNEPFPPSLAAILFLRHRSTGKSSRPRCLEQQPPSPS
jgi:hypothetical protein